MPASPFVIPAFIPISTLHSVHNMSQLLAHQQRKVEDIKFCNISFLYVQISSNVRLFQIYFLPSPVHYNSNILINASFRADIAYHEVKNSVAEVCFVHGSTITVPCPKYLGNHSRRLFEPRQNGSWLHCHPEFFCASQFFSAML